MRYSRLSLLLSLIAATTVLAQAQTLNEQLLDPTQPPKQVKSGVASTSHKPFFRVESIMRGDNHQLAIINGKRVREGDQIQGAKVVKINRDAVILSWQGQQERYRINKPLKKKWVN